MFVRGYDNFDVEVEKNKQLGMKSIKAKNRLYAKKNGSINFVFLDDPGIGLNEHQLTLPGPNNYNNFYTCLGDICPICLSQLNRPYFCAPFTVFDLTPWVKDGKQHHFTRKLYTPKNSEIAAIKKLRQDFGGSLKGAVLTMTKGGGQKDRAAVSPYLHNGSIMRLSDQQIVQMALNDGYKPDVAQPFNYELVFALDSIQTLNAIIPRIVTQNNNNNNRQQPQSYDNNYNQPYMGGGFGQVQSGFQGQPSYPQPPQQVYPSAVGQPFPLPQGQQNGFIPGGQQFNSAGHQGFTPPPPQGGVPLHDQGHDDSIPDIPF